VKTCIYFSTLPSLYDQPSGVGERPSLVAPFQSLLVLYSLLCRDSAVRRFLYGIGFQSPDEWEKEWSEECTAEDLFNAVESDEAPPAAMVLAGYMRFCQYARNTNEVLEYIEDFDILDRARCFEFKDRIRNIQAWRLNLSSGDTAKRFDKVRERLNKMIEEALTKLGLVGDVKRVERLFDDTFDLLPKLEPATV
jgi:hypothetical protein